MSLIVTVQDLCKSYEQNTVSDLVTSWVLDHLSFSIASDEFVSLMGPSGCGKSTLLNILGTVDKPTSGTVMVAGQSVQTLNDTQRTELRREKIGFVFQSFNLLMGLTVLENVMIPLQLQGKQPYLQMVRQATELLSNVGLENRLSYFPAQLSGGEMQRVAIARALVHQPALLLADEPTGNLDSKNGERILSLLKQLHANGQTIVMATHSQEAAAYTSRTLRLLDGRLDAS